MSTPDEDCFESVTDPLGRPVNLSQERWAHVEDGHDDMRGRKEEVKAAIASAEKRTRGRFEDTEKLWARNLGPARWLVVVVRYEGGHGSVRTAYGCSKSPKAETEL